VADVIYKKHNCPGCVVVENALRANPIAGLRLINIEDDRTAKQYFDLTGSSSLPTAVIDGQPHIGAANILRALRAKYGRP
jgi:glutaredoxin